MANLMTADLSEADLSGSVLANNFRFSRSTVNAVTGFHLSLGKSVDETQIVTNANSSLLLTEAHFT
jgi:hypothetical protein